MFLAGDAAHLMPPNGGFGGNTGIHDAHNLAWKLALVLNGYAGPANARDLRAERRPVSKFTVEQAYTRYVTRTATYLGATDFQPVAPDFNIEIGYLYNSPAIVAEPGEAKVHGDPRDDLRAAGLARPSHLARAEWQADVVARPVRQWLRAGGRIAGRGMARGRAAGWVKFPDSRSRSL